MTVVNHVWEMTEMPIHHLRTDIYSNIAAMIVLACLVASSVVLATSWDKANDTLLTIIATLLTVRFSGTTSDIRTRIPVPRSDVIQSTPIPHIIK